MPNDARSSHCLHGVKSVAGLLRIPYTESEISAFGPPPLPVSGYLRFFDPGWSIRELDDRFTGWRLSWTNPDWHGMFNRSFFYSNDDSLNFRSFEFAKRVERPCYRQIRMDADRASFGKTFVEQQQWLACRSANPFPTARVAVTGMVVHFCLSGQRLYRDYLVRCRDSYVSGSRVVVGKFNSSIRFGYPSDDVCDWKIGTVDSRRAPQTLQPGAPAAP